MLQSKGLLTPLQQRFVNFFSTLPDQTQFVTAQMCSNAASDNAMNRLDPRFLTTDHRQQTTRTLFCGQWSVVGGQKAVQVTDKSSNGYGVEL